MNTIKLLSFYFDWTVLYFLTEGIKWPLYATMDHSYSSYNFKSWDKDNMSLIGLDNFRW